MCVCVRSLLSIEVDQGGKWWDILETFQLRSRQFPDIWVLRKYRYERMCSLLEGRRPLQEAGKYRGSKAPFYESLATWYLSVAEDNKTLKGMRWTLWSENVVWWNCNWNLKKKLNYFLFLATVFTQCMSKEVQDLPFMFLSSFWQNSAQGFHKK